MISNNNATNRVKVFNIPNILSLFRICLIPLIIWLYCVKENYVLSGIILIISGITDIVDGYIARHCNMMSDLGKILDPIADKLTQVTMLICLIIRFPLIVLPLVLLVIKETFMSVTGFLVIRRTGIVPGANWHGKAATVFLYATMIIHILCYDITVGYSTIMIVACTFMIAVSFLLYGIKFLKILIAAKMNRTVGK